jgi:hypothetical protein
MLMINFSLLFLFLSSHSTLLNQEYPFWESYRWEIKELNLPLQRTQFSGMRIAVVSQSISIADTSENLNDLLPKTNSRDNPLVKVIATRDNPYLAGICPNCTLFNYSLDKFIKGTQDTNSILASCKIILLAEVTGYRKEIKAAIDILFKKGCVIIVPVAFYDSYSARFPAGYKHVLTVSGYDKEYYLNSYKGFKVDLSAPNTEVGYLVQNDSTSMSSSPKISAALITGLASLIWVQHPDWTRDDLIGALLASTSQNYQKKKLAIPDYQLAINCGSEERLKYLRKYQLRHTNPIPAITYFFSDEFCALEHKLLHDARETKRKYGISKYKLGSIYFRPSQFKSTTSFYDRNLFNLKRMSQYASQYPKLYPQLLMMLRFFNSIFQTRKITDKYIEIQDWIKTTIKDWIKVEPDSATPWIEFGYELAYEKNTPAAKRAVNHALKLNPNNYQAWMLKYMLASHDGNIGDKCIALNQILKPSLMPLYREYQKDCKQVK